MKLRVAFMLVGYLTWLWIWKRRTTDITEWKEVLISPSQLQDPCSLRFEFKVREWNQSPPLLIQVGHLSETNVHLMSRIDSAVIGPLYIKTWFWQSILFQVEASSNADLIFVNQKITSLNKAHWGNFEQWQPLFSLTSFTIKIQEVYFKEVVALL